MNLPLIKIKKQSEFQLIETFHSKLDAQRKLKQIRNENRCFAKKDSFLFSSQNQEITFSYGVYEEVFYAKPTSNR